MTDSAAPSTQRESKCSRCKKVLPSSSFSPDRSRPSGCASYCKPCAAERSRIRYQDPEARGRDRVSRRDYELRLAYGLSAEQYDEMLVAQNGVCAVCSQPPTKSLHGVLHVDHCHESGKVRGLLCSDCNITLGKFQDDPDRFLSAAAYLLQNEDLLSKLGE